MSEWISRACIAVFGEQPGSQLTAQETESLIFRMAHVADVKIKAKCLGALSKLAGLSEYVECTIEAVQSQGIDMPTWIDPGTVKISLVGAASGIWFEMLLSATCIHYTTKTTVEFQHLVSALSLMWHDDDTLLELHWDLMGKLGAMIRVSSKTENGKKYAAVIAPTEG